jgi:hypothetical protein
MVRSPTQFTIGQLVKLTACAAVYLWLLRGTDGTSVFIVFPVVDGVLYARIKGRMGLARSTLLRLVVLVVFEIAYCTYFSYFPARDAAMNARIAGVVYFVLVTFEAWVALLSRSWGAVVIGHDYRMPPSDQECGPIV